jgi:homoserine O-acetyltransferase
MTSLQHIDIPNFTLKNKTQLNLSLSYEVFGKPLFTAPIVLVNHALTGNSSVAESEGWWGDIIGAGKVIDTDNYTVLCFNIPGNGYDGQTLENYTDFATLDIAGIFIKGLETLHINRLHSIIGGSIGGAIAWQMAQLAPTLCTHLIPIATHWNASDWVLANVHIQELILNNSKRPLEDARIHAMLTYRTPESLSYKFQRSKNLDSGEFQIASWLEHHGSKLKKRFKLNAYKLMNQLLKTIEVTHQAIDLKAIDSDIHLIAIDTDYLFVAADQEKTYRELLPHKENIYYHTIQSIHGHDAFLIEYPQLEQILKPIFQCTKA